MKEHDYLRAPGHVALEHPHFDVEGVPGPALSVHEDLVRQNARPSHARYQTSFLRSILRHEPRPQAAPVALPVPPPPPHPNQCWRSECRKRFIIARDWTEDNTLWLVRKTSAWSAEVNPIPQTQQAYYFDFRRARLDIQKEGSTIECTPSCSHNTPSRARRRTRKPSRRSLPIGERAS